MTLYRIIVFLLIISVIVVDGRVRRKRHQDQRSSAYYTTSGQNPYSNLAYALSLYNLGNTLQPIGNNWYVPGFPPYPYYNPFTYNNPNNGYPSGYGVVQYTGPGLNMQYPNNMEAYIGQSYVPLNNEWLPLPGVNRRRQ